MHIQWGIVGLTEQCGCTVRTIMCACTKALLPVCEHAVKALVS